VGSSGMMQYPGSTQMLSSGMGFDVAPTAFSSPAWGRPNNVNPIGQFMPNGMFGFQNQMGKRLLPSKLATWRDLLIDDRCCGRDARDGNGPDGCDSGYVRGLWDEHE